MGRPNRKGTVFDAQVRGPYRSFALNGHFTNRRENIEPIAINSCEYISIFGFGRTPLVRATTGCSAAHSVARDDRGRESGLDANRLTSLVVDEIQFRQTEKLGSAVAQLKHRPLQSAPQ
jgi:hypothetical protein